jgi:hypothetical protein
VGIFFLKAIFENYLETGSRQTPSKFDVGPINTMVSQNFYDGLRLRLSGQTTANLMPRLFWKGYYAYGTRHREHYYNAELTYSFLSPEYLPQEFPQRHITLAAQRDVALPSDKFVTTDKDNVFTSFKIHEIDKMFMYNSQKLSFNYETQRHLRFSLTMKTEKIEPVGNIAFLPLSASDGLTPPLNHIRYTEVTAGLRLAPKEQFFNTKQRRRTITHDAWYVSLQHTTGLKNILGGQYNYNFTELSCYRRNWLPMSWGHIDTRIKAGKQWNQVPWPLLPMAQANLSYIIDYRLFNMLNNMEFMNDRFASLMITWDLSGRLFNRMPIIKRWHWREFFGVRTLWGTLSDKNNPALARNAGSDHLMVFPEGVNVMDSKKPYVEVMVGIHNICKFFNIDYVRRLNYNELPTSPKWGLRYSLSLTF